MRHSYIRRQGLRTKPRSTGRLMRIVAAGAVALPMFAAAADPAAARSAAGCPAPNYCHFDADAVTAERTGARVAGRVYWDSYAAGHIDVTVTDRLPYNGKRAITQVWVKRGSAPAVHVWNLAADNTSARYTLTLPAGSGTITWIEFRVGQAGDREISLATDRNVPGGY